MTEESLLAAIGCQPEEDTPRLVYADFLEEGDAVRVKCPKCRGTRYRKQERSGLKRFTEIRCECKTGTVVDTSRRDRAELIHVQIELARKPGRDCGYRPGRRQPPWCSDPACGSCVLYIRERDLLAANPSWLTLPCPECKGEPIGACNFGQGTVYPQCATCGGTGDLLRRPRTDFHARNAGEWGRDLAGQIELRASLARGFPVVTASLTELIMPCPSGCSRERGRESVDYECEKCNGTAIAATPWASAVVRSSPASGFEVSDRKPNTTTVRNEASWYFHNGTALDYDHWLPEVWTQPMRKAAPDAEWRRHWDSSNRWAVVIFTAAEAAVAALNRAAGILVRGAARG